MNTKYRKADKYNHGFAHRSPEFGRMWYVCNKNKITYQEYCENRELYDVKHERKKHLHLTLYSPDYYKTIYLKKKYNITLEEYNDILKKQNNVCLICEKEESNKKKKTNSVIKLAVDHCHKTGKIRGLLCTSCNTGLGNFKDDILLLDKALNYLKSNLDSII